MVGGRRGLTPQLRRGFVAPGGSALPTPVRALAPTKDEESYLSRVKSVDGFGYDLTEVCYCAAAGVMKCRRRRGMHT